MTKLLNGECVKCYEFYSELEESFGLVCNECQKNEALNFCYWCNKNEALKKVFYIYDNGEMIALNVCASCASSHLKGNN